ncbi:glycerophosphoryl diester phosphodiesterase [Ascobolus immersus RN42]|uniref:Glycerophosphoryl diester phosphodiesterase n=1 Tax=Ascobolus immersus RN42 TaxID=1160509 RepID=A0A3N4IC39_ASCIM|nr:glycerophosphoryl diester phosphodiesterase [Ascobolus immersus RN42]
MRSHFALLFAAVTALVSSVNAAPSKIQKRKLEVQAHRGGLGIRPESTLWAFAYSMEIGVDVLEMDMVFTKDGVPVVWHEHSILEAKCLDTAPGAKYVGQLIANLTLAQVKTLDCGSKLLPAYPQSKRIPGAKIPTLEEVLDLVDCYGDRKVKINLETKLDPLEPAETLPVEKYINDIVPILIRRKFDKRTTIQSFDWRTIIAIKKKWPHMQTVALLDDTTITEDDGRGRGYYPWLGGIDLKKDFKGDYIAAAKSIGASVLSPIHGITSATSVNNPAYKPFVTKRLVDKTHKNKMELIPWTVDDESTIEKLILDGVDAIISNYPERVIYVGRKLGYSPGNGGRKQKLSCLKKAGGVWA